MSYARRQTVLFLICAAVLLATGYAWGYANAYNRFYSPEASLEREIVHLDFNGRVLHYNNLGQREQCRRELVTQLRQEIAYTKGLLAAASADARNDAERKLRQAELAIAGQPISAVAPSGPVMPAPEMPPVPPGRP